jgi:hypothetical protein
VQSDKDAIDAIVGVFFDAFTNGSGVPQNIDRLYEVFMPEAIVVQNVHGATEVFDVRGFVEPRRTILTNGRLQDFREWEVSESTEIFGSIAQRFSRYEKSWTVSGEDFSGAGVKSLQFARTADGWKISALAWDDV